MESKTRGLAPSEAAKGEASREERKKKDNRRRCRVSPRSLSLYGLVYLSLGASIRPRGVIDRISDEKISARAIAARSCSETRRRVARNSRYRVPGNTDESVASSSMFGYIAHRREYNIQQISTVGRYPFRVTFSTCEVDSVKTVDRKFVPRRNRLKASRIEKARWMLSRNSIEQVERVNGRKLSDANGSQYADRIRPAAISVSLPITGKSCARSFR